jgi:hypothetical protein
MSLCPWHFCGQNFLPVLLLQFEPSVAPLGEAEKESELLYQDAQRKEVSHIQNRILPQDNCLEIQTS